MLQQGRLAPEHDARQAERINEQAATLQRLEAVDMRLTLDNERLQPVIEANLATAFEQIPGWRGKRLDVRFYRGYIALDAEGTYAMAGSEAETVQIAGDVRLDFQTGRLAWRPELHALSRAGGPTSDPGDAAPEVTDAELLQLLSAELEFALEAAGTEFFMIEPMPLGVLETGMRLAAPFQDVSAASSLLEGVLTTSGVATLILSLIHI